MTKVEEHLQRRQPCSDQVLRRYRALLVALSTNLLSSFPFFPYSCQGHERIYYNASTHLNLAQLNYDRVHHPVTCRYIKTIQPNQVIRQYLACPPHTKPTVSLKPQELPRLYIYKHPFLAKSSSHPRPRCLLSFCTPARPTCFLAKENERGTYSVTSCMTPRTCLLSPARHDATELKGSSILDAPRTLIFSPCS